jgi:hypothetical protein
VSTAVRVRAVAIGGSAVHDVGAAAAAQTRWPPFVGGTAVVEPQLPAGSKSFYPGFDGSTSITSPPVEVRTRKRGSVWDRLAKLRLSIPDDEQASYPRDATRDLDGYLRRQRLDQTQ